MSIDNKFKIILLGSNSISTNILYNSLKSDFNIQKVIIEEKESKFLFFKKEFLGLSEQRISLFILFFL